MTKHEHIVLDSRLEKDIVDGNFFGDFVAPSFYVLENQERPLFHVQGGKTHRSKASANKERQRMFDDERNHRRNIAYVFANTQLKYVEDSPAYEFLFSILPVDQAFIAKGKDAMQREYRLILKEVLQEVGEEAGIAVRVLQENNPILLLMSTDVLNSLYAKTLERIVATGSVPYVMDVLKGDVVNDPELVSTMVERAKDQNVTDKNIHDLMRENLFSAPRWQEALEAAGSTVDMSVINGKNRMAKVTKTVESLTVYLVDDHRGNIAEFPHSKYAVERGRHLVNKALKEVEDVAKLFDMSSAHAYGLPTPDDFFWLCSQYDKEEMTAAYLIFAENTADWNGSEATARAFDKTSPGLGKYRRNHERDWFEYALNNEFFAALRQKVNQVSEELYNGEELVPLDMVTHMVDYDKFREDTIDAVINKIRRIYLGNEITPVASW